MINSDNDPIVDLSTSVTRDDAVMYLLGWWQGPVRRLSKSEGYGSGEMENYEPTLHEILANDREVAEIDYSNAKAEKLAPEVVAEKLALLNKCDLLISKAHKFLCDIDDELAKGGISALRVDPRKTKNPDYPYITLRSLKEWASKHPDALNVTETHLSSQQKVQAVPMARTKQRDQENAIVAEIKRLRYDPKSLPKNLAGSPGVKAKVRAALKQNPLFRGTKVFDKAWERLRGYGDITNQK